jgi:hypothetical protein
MIPIPNGQAGLADLGNQRGLASGCGEGSEASGALGRGGPIWLATWRGGLRAGPSTGPTLGVGLKGS